MDNMDDLIVDITKRLTDMKGRLAVDQADLDHMLGIYRIAFAAWYDPDNEACAKMGRKIDEHIRPLNAKFKFKA